MTIKMIHIMYSIIQPDPIVFSIQVCLEPGHTHKMISFKELETYLIEKLGKQHKPSIIEYSNLKQQELNQLSTLGQKLKEVAAKNGEARFKKLHDQAMFATRSEYRLLAKSCEVYADNKLQEVGYTVVDYAEQLNAYQRQFEIPHGIRFQIKPGIVPFLNRSTYRCEPVDPKNYYGLQVTQHRVRSSASSSL